MKPGKTVEVEVESLSYGRAAVSRVDGRVIFVGGAAPGDRALVRIRTEHSSYDEADLVEVVRNGPSRVPAPCPIVGRCGGCPWQHVAYDTQLEAKRNALVDCLQRIAGIERPPVTAIVPSPKSEEYRNRIKLRFDGTRLGFYRARSHEIVEVGDCLIAEASIRTALPAVAETLRALRTEVTRVEIIDLGLEGGIGLALNARGRLRKVDDRAVRACLSNQRNEICGIMMWGRGWRRSWGRTGRSIRVGQRSHAIDFGGGSFGQVNTEANLLLIGEVVSAAAAGSGDDVLDLYAGSGNFSFPLARSAHRVRAVESDPAAIAAARRTIEREGLENVSFTLARVEQYLAESGEHGAGALRPELIVVDPPRSGLGDACVPLARIRARRTVYAACQPATLARDLSVMLRNGYRLCRAVPVDMFPHTFHVEAVCTLELT